ncbi:MAG: DUF4118 domain-containing protein [Ruminococcaceae bacterium]|nr:DUF4118 domain-containing protein [Oscillospiraceae bacterium]
MQKTHRSLRTALKEIFPRSLRGWLVLFGALGTASLVCFFLMMGTTSDVHVPMIFVLAVLVVSLMTNGYFYGLLAAFLSVIGVNYAFTFPYLKLDFSFYGYPLTFFTMLTVGLATSTLTTRLKEQEKIHAESEREKMRANLLRAVSHDLRTPLTAISGSITTVLEGRETLPEQEQLNLLADARDDAEWLCRMVENLLSVTRVGSNGPRGIVKEDELLEEVLSAAVISFRKKHSDMVVSATVPDEFLLIPMDATLIEQVLLNLMENAAVHGQGTTRITICAQTKDNMAEIRIRDNGQGIPPQLLPHLFDGTASFAAQKTESRGSMGIGLSVCRTIVEAHGGSIRAANTHDKGAEFVFTLPLNKGTEDKELDYDY